MNEQMQKLELEAIAYADSKVPADNRYNDIYHSIVRGKFAELIVRECIRKIETHRIPVGNSAAGEMACEWTYEALKEIRDDIKQNFGVEE